MHRAVRCLELEALGIGCGAVDYPHIAFALLILRHPAGDGRRAHLMVIDGSGSDTHGMRRTLTEKGASAYRGICGDEAAKQGA